MGRKIEELDGVVDWLNKNYSQDSESYSIFNGAKPEVIRYNGHIAISLWACGAIVCIYDHLYFIGEDDGYWFVMEQDGKRDYYAFQDSFSIGWAESFANAMTNLKKYVDEHGKPVYYVGMEMEVVCHYRLEDEEK